VTRTLTALAVAVLLCTPGVQAQTQPVPVVQGVPAVPDTEAAPINAGPLWVKPAVSLSNLGVETNVFNEPDSQSPEDDFTFTFSPQADVYFRIGRTWLLGVVREELVWYQEYSDQRSVNDLYRLDWLVPLTRVAFSVGGSLLDTRERPGFEIDSRAERTEVTGNAAVEIRALSQTLIGVRGARRTVGFDEDQFFDGTDLEQELNRTETGVAFTMRHELTPLTSLMMEVMRQQDRFEFSPERDTDSTRLDGGLRFDPDALLKGSARIGYRRFDPRSPDVPGYSGFTLAANLAYVARESTQLTVTATRDVEYSYDESRPYYLLTGMQAGVAQQVYGPVDVQGRFGLERLSYRDRAGAPVDLAGRVDRIRSYGGGIGYRLGVDLRLGVNVDQIRRLSDLEDHQYDGLRYGVTVVYGL
jgi:hypothetical protein